MKDSKLYLLLNEGI